MSSADLIPTYLRFSDYEKILSVSEFTYLDVTFLHRHASSLVHA